MGDAHTADASAGPGGGYTEPNYGNARYALIAIPLLHRGMPATTVEAQRNGHQSRAALPL
jgi:hypothetical protein